MENSFDYFDILSQIYYHKLGGKIKHKNHLFLSSIDDATLSVKLCESYVVVGNCLNGLPISTRERPF